MTLINKPYVSKLFRFLVKRSSTRSLNSNSNLNNNVSDMSRGKNMMDAMRQHRVNVKEKKQKYLPGLLNLQVLGSGSQGTPRSIYLFTDQTRYLFNCSEGTQRLALEHKCKLAKLEHIFITSPTWANVGGLPGMALSAQDIGAPHLTLHGPSGIDQLFRATEKFIVLRGLHVSQYDCDSNPVFKDDVMTVRYVRLTKKENSCEASKSDHSLDDINDVTDCDPRINRNGKRLRSNDSEARKYQRRESPSLAIERISDVMAYICKLNSRQGTLSLEKCLQLGVPPGPLLGELKDGKDVTLPNGNIVRSCDVCLPDDVGSVFIVLECPTVDYLDSLVENPMFKEYQRTTSIDENLAYCIIHFTPQDVMADSRYIEWMHKFGPSTLHLVLNDKIDCIESEAVHRMQYKLNLLHPTIFPLLKEPDNDESKYNITEEEKDKPAVESDGKFSQEATTQNIKSISSCMIIHGKTLDKIYLRPKKGLDRNLCLTLQPDEYIKEAEANDGFLDVIEDLKTKIASKMKTIGEVPEYPKLLFLGTGSCAPNKNRNTSGILLRINESTSFILDCGEGTLTQILRFYGKSVGRDVLATVKGIYVSHLHADHHMGLIGLLNARRQVSNDETFVLAPRQIVNWLNFYHNRFEPILDKLTFIPNDDLNLYNSDKLTEGKYNKIFSQLNAKNINTVNVKHVPNSFGISIVLEDGFKITYSGDTMPCENLIELGTDSNILIHEATMEDDLEMEAKLKLHSTTSQAIGVGKKMNAKFILLTHFSQRYAKIPRFSNEVEQRVGIAFDNMEIRMGELDILPLLHPALRVLFSEACEELDNRAARRKLRMQYS